MSATFKSPESARADVFTEAVESLARKLGVAASDTPMPISKFKSDYSGLLRDARAGALQQISRGGERYLVLSEAQVIAMERSSSQRRTLADTLASVQAPSSALDTGAALLPGAQYDAFTLPTAQDESQAALQAQLQVQSQA
ncbi:hypothetical protein GCM10022279_05680 [Comamonas faecalis]|uniref:Uncharacterized protein n=1 Tax=Comamonas faecalis TaxID=1387849 RepID=A0ABP7QQN9_9BURK